MSCKEIEIGSNPDCENLPVGGTEPQVIAINWADLDADYPFTYNGDGKIINVNMKAGKKGYAFYGFRNDAKNLAEVVNPGIGPNGVKQTVGFVIYDRTQLLKNTIKKFIKGKFVFVTILKGRDADAIVVNGSKVGLEIVPGGIWDAGANGGYYILTFANPEGEIEHGLPVTLGTSYTDGLAIIDDILAS